MTFEGVEGSGKSTQLARVAQLLDAGGIDTLVVREPGHTAVGEGVRAILLDPAGGGMEPIAELMLFEAARAQLVIEVIRPALAAGRIVLCDRYADSTTAYQGYGRGLDLELVEGLNAASTGGLVPDVTLLFDIDADAGLARATAGGADRIEGEGHAFHERVRQGYLRIARAEPDRVRVVDASGSVEEVWERVADVLAAVPVFASAFGTAR